LTATVGNFRLDPMKSTRISPPESEADVLLARLTTEGHVLSATGKAVHIEVSAAWFDEMAAWRSEDSEYEMDDGYGEASAETDSQYDVVAEPERRVFISSNDASDRAYEWLFGDKESFAKTMVELQKELAKVTADQQNAERQLNSYLAELFGED